MDSGALPDLIEIIDGQCDRVMSIGDADAAAYGVRTTGNEPGLVPRYDVLGHYAQLAADGRFAIPIGKTFRLDDWREAMKLSLSGKAHGKLLLLTDRTS